MDDATTRREHINNLVMALGPANRVLAEMPEAQRTDPRQIKDSVRVVRDLHSRLTTTEWAELCSGTYGPKKKSLFDLAAAIVDRETGR